MTRIKINEAGVEQAEQSSYVLCCEESANGGGVLEAPSCRVQGFC